VQRDAARSQRRTAPVGTVHVLPVLTSRPVVRHVVRIGVADAGGQVRSMSLVSARPTAVAGGAALGAIIALSMPYAL
jgi:hypothetical protein